MEPANAFSKIRRVIGVVSGKGGVGKSFVTASMAAALQKKGYQTAVLDADVTGPSIPKSFGVTGKMTGSAQGMLPAVSKNGTEIASVNLLIDKEDTPVIWRGPVIAGVVKQFWSEVFWGEVDYMFVDMPPGTGDVPLTVFQSLPLDGIIVVTSPQDLVSMIVKKAVNMANAMEIPILGIVENYSYMTCSCCGKQMPVFGESHIDEIAGEMGLKVLAKLPLDPNLSKMVDQGQVEQIPEELFAETAAFIEQVCPAEDREQTEELSEIAVVTGEDGQIFGHFGSCQQITLYHIEDGAITGEELIQVPESGHEAVAKLLADHKTDVLICGGIGLGAMQALMEKHIMVVPGQQGAVCKAAEAFLNGTLEDSDTPTCNHHEEGCCCSGSH